MEQLKEFLQREYLGNVVRDYLIAVGIIVFGIVLVAIFKRVVLTRLKRWAEKTETTVDDYIVNVFEKFVMPMANFVVIYLGITYLTIPEKGMKFIGSATAVVITYYIIRLVSTLVRTMLETYVRKQENGAEKVKQLAGVMIIINVAIWLLGLVFLFDNMGYDVTAVVTGLGIGGIAIALAAQNILGDLFNYFVIFFDRPFEVGDFISVDAKMGHVEHIGIKTTRLRSITGERLVFSNSDLTNSRIHNFKHLERRRVAFIFGINRSTPARLLREIPGIVQGIIEAETDVTFDRAHFLRYGESSLDFEVVYFVENPDNLFFMNKHQSINFQLIEAFQARGIEFSFPTRTLQIVRDEAPGMLSTSMHFPLSTQDESEAN